MKSDLNFSKSFDAAERQAPALERKAYSISQLREVLSLGRSSIYALIRQGTLKTVRIGRRTLVLASSVDDLLRQDGDHT